MNNWFFKYKDSVAFILVMIICLFMALSHIKEGSTTFNIVKWFIILGMTIVLFIRNIKQKKNRY